MKSLYFSKMFFQFNFFNGKYKLLHKKHVLINVDLHTH